MQMIIWKRARQKNRFFDRQIVNWRLLFNRMLTFLSISSLALFAFWPWLPWGKPLETQTIVVYGFSILGEVMNNEILPAFQAEWEQQTGERIEFITSFAGSGTITNQLILGVPADIAILSTELDAFRLVENGVLPKDSWRQLPNQGILNRSPFIILVRQGNPKIIHGFDNLAKPGIEIVHPDPLTSGGAQWAILAEYGSALLTSQDDARAYDQLLGIWENVIAQAASARSARTQFENGFGDALITYEQEALRDKSLGTLNAEIIYPESTILSEHTVVVLDKNINAEEREVIDSLLQFLWSDTAQQIFVENGYRSVNETLNSANSDFGSISNPFLVGDLGGWIEAKQQIVDSIWKDKVLQEIAP
jgi:sulfate transport system substrate-binding protein